MDHATIQQKLAKPLHKVLSGLSTRLTNGLSNRYGKSSEPLPSEEATIATLYALGTRGFFKLRGLHATSFEELERVLQKHDLPRLALIAAFAPDFYDIPDINPYHLTDENTQAVTEAVCRIFDPEKWVAFLESKLEKNIGKISLPNYLSVFTKEDLFLLTDEEINRAFPSHADRARTHIDFCVALYGLPPREELRGIAVESGIDLTRVFEKEDREKFAKIIMRILGFETNEPAPLPAPLPILPVTLPVALPAETSPSPAPAPKTKRARSAKNTQTASAQNWILNYLPEKELPSTARAAFVKAAEKDEKLSDEVHDLVNDVLITMALKVFLPSKKTVKSASKDDEALKHNALISFVDQELRETLKSQFINAVLNSEPVNRSVHTAVTKAYKRHIRKTLPAAEPLSA